MLFFGNMAVTPGRMKALRGKAEKTVFPMAIFVACLMVLTSCLVTFNTGFQGCRSYLAPRIEESSLQYHASFHGLMEDAIIHRHLDRVQEHVLRQRLFETHNECLARAITVGDTLYDGYPYQKYPDIIDQTIEWAEDNCARLMFTPSTRSTSPEVLFAVNKIGEMTTSAYRWLQYTIGTNARWMSRWFQSKLLGKEAFESKPHLYTFTNSGKHYIIQLPDNFALNCDLGYICHLVHKASSDDVSVTAGATKVTIRALSQTLRKLKMSDQVAEKMELWTRLALLYVFIPLQLFATIKLSFVIYLRGLHDRFPEMLFNLFANGERNFPDIEIAIMKVGVQVIIQQVLFMANLMAPLWLKAKITALSLFLGFVMLTDFTIANDEKLWETGNTTTLNCLVWALARLYGIWMTPSEDAHTTGSNEPATLADDAPVADFDVLGHPRARIPLDTSLQEDIKQELLAMRDQHVAGGFPLVEIETVVYEDSDESVDEVSHKDVNEETNERISDESHKALSEHSNNTEPPPTERIEMSDESEAGSEWSIVGSN